MVRVTDYPGACDFSAGHWVVDQTIGSHSGGTTADYRADGTFAGYYILFNGATAEKMVARNFHLFATFAAMLTTRTRRFSAAKGSLGFLSLLLP